MALATVAATVLLLCISVCVSVVIQRRFLDLPLEAQKAALGDNSGWVDSD